MAVVTASANLQNEAVMDSQPITNIAANASPLPLGNVKGRLTGVQVGGSAFSGQAVTDPSWTLNADASFSGLSSFEGLPGVNAASVVSGQAISTAKLLRTIEISATFTMSGEGSVAAVGPVTTYTIPYTEYTLPNAGRNSGMSATISFYPRTSGGPATAPMGNQYVAPILLDGETVPRMQLFCRFLEPVQETLNGGHRVKCHVWVHGTSSVGIGISVLSSDLFRIGRAFKIMLGEDRIIGGGVITGPPPSRGLDIQFTSFGLPWDGFTGT